MRWVADHRRHHAFSDRDGDPHSPWRYGTSVGALAKGLFHAHMGWLFDYEQTNPRKYAPDLLADRDIAAVSRRFMRLVLVSLLLPAVLGGLLSWSWQGAVTAFFWASLVRISLLHHVTWSINSICHVMGEQPFRSRDQSGNVWWLAIPSFGESWHNLHHADPTCARHGVLRGQIDISARVIGCSRRSAGPSTSAGRRLNGSPSVRRPDPSPPFPALPALPRPRRADARQAGGVGAGQAGGVGAGREGAGRRGAGTATRA